MHPFVHDIQNFALDILFPVSCLHCDEPQVPLCERCLATFTKLKNQTCIICQKPSLHGMTHSSCMTSLTPDGCLSVHDYHDKHVAEAITTGKYSFVPELYKILGTAISDFIAQERLQNYFKGFHICPIPLAETRKRWRGFNQSEILAQTLGETLSLPSENILRRTIANKVQKNLDKQQRKENVHGVFGINNNAKTIGQIILDQLFESEKIPQIKISAHGKNILLIDDVVTTGNTLLEATKTLKRNGAKSVWCITVARD